MTNITRDQLQKDIDSKKNFTLIDALPSDSYTKGHLPGAKSMPVDTVGDTAPSWLQDKNQPIVTYCGNANCPKSRMAAEKLKSWGFTNVSEYSEGLEDWNNAGLKLETSAQGENAYGSGEANKKSAA